MAATDEAKIGKFTFTVQESKESGPKVQDRIEAIANWLLKQWQNNNLNNSNQENS